MNEWDLMDWERADPVLSLLPRHGEALDTDRAIDAALRRELLPMSAVGMLPLWYACESLWRMARSRAAGAWRDFLGRHPHAIGDDLHRYSATAARRATP